MIADFIIAPGDWTDNRGLKRRRDGSYVMYEKYERPPGADERSTSHSIPTSTASTDSTPPPPRARALAHRQPRRGRGSSDP